MLGLNILNFKDQIVCPIHLYKSIYFVNIDVIEILYILDRDRKLGLSVTISDRDAEAYREYLREHGSEQLKDPQQ